VITPDDIRNPKRISGFNHVGFSAQTPTCGPYTAQIGASSDDARYWRGPRRKDPLVAAQDYCDYVNGNPPSVPSIPTMRGGLKTAGHSASREAAEIPSDVEAAYGMIRDFRAQQSGKPGYVYLIIEEHPGGALVYGKIGFSTNPQKRVAELQTGNPRTLRLYCAKRGTLDDELALHRRHIDKNVLQEWFRLDPALLLEWDAGDIIKDKEAA
jgi:hypothetical protein